MHNGNKTALRECRFLSEDHFELLYQTFIEAFSDYVFPFALTETQFRNHINLNGVDLDRTIGVFDHDRLVGFSLNGFGKWDGRSTLYDAGTGVIPAMRRQGLSEAMFDHMLPGFVEQGVEQCLLEVITTNSGAIRLYEKLDFHPLRELALLQCDKAITTSCRNADVEIRKVDDPDWGRLITFWDGEPSWQNSVDAIQRSCKLKTILGAYLRGECVGYLIYSTNFGRIAQIAVAREHRNKGIATTLVERMQAETASGYSVQAINIDKSLENVMAFFTNRGFYERVSQYEMLKRL